MIRLWLQFKVSGIWFLLPSDYQCFSRYPGVVAEEMLYLSLAGNILRAVGGKLRLYDLNYIRLFHHSQC